MLARSDLYEKTGKSPHAFCTDIDREGDVRVLANIVPNEYWMGTMLHELGHAVYSSKNIPQTRALRAARRGAHPDHRRRGDDVRAVLASSGRLAGEDGRRRSPTPQAFDEAGAKMRRNQLLIFSRWCQVMLRFEKAMYENPEQDLNKLWWDLVEKYQGLQAARRAATRPDYASKIHIVSAPVYYHNYMMGQLFASQVHHAIARDVYNGADPNDGDLRRQQEGRRVHEEEGVRPGPDADLERADEARDRRATLNAEGVRGGLQAVSARES